MIASRAEHPVDLRQFRTLASSLELHWEDGHRQKVSWWWLRDQDPRSRHANGQKLSTTQEWPESVRPETVTQEGDIIRVTWSDDGHTSLFNHHQLRGPGKESISGGKVLWNRMLSPEMCFFDFEAMESDERRLLEWLEMIPDFGFAGLRNVPTDSDALERVIGWFGQIRETNFGRIFDIKSLPNPRNLSDSNLALPPRTENPYRDPAPGLHAIHCISPAATGGEVILVDGYFVLQKVKKRLSQGFDLLTQIPVRFHYQDEQVWLESERCLVQLGLDGQVSSLAFNNRSVDPFSLPASHQEAWYCAYRKLEHEILAPENQLKFKMNAGDLLLIDNRRVLHGQTAYAERSGRLLRGCYAEQDGLRSKIRRLHAGKR